jgi:hypothetical protein
MVVQHGYFNASIAARHKTFIEGLLRVGVRPRLRLIDPSANLNVRITGISSRFLTSGEAKVSGGRVCLLRFVLSKGRFPLLTY